MLLIAPSAQHRVLWRCNDKEYVVRMANRYAIAGLAAVAVAMVGALLFVSILLLHSPAAGVIAAVAAAGALWAWYLQPLLRRRYLYRNARPAVRPLNRQPPRKVPSSAR
jgi:Family of unknown function (DUF6328)